jgi:diacylglycerol O-acyltransferase
MDGPTREPMGAVDAAWLRMDRPENTADVVALLRFGELPSMARIRRLVEERLLACRRFRQVVTPDGAWEDDPAFDLDRHLSRRRLASVPALRAHLGRTASETLPRDAPLWRVEVVALPRGGALVAKLHHCIADGFALVSLLLSLSDEGGAPAPPAGHVLPAFRRFAPWLEGPWALARDLVDPRRAGARALEVAGLAAAVARITAMPAAGGTRLGRAVTGERRVAWSRGIPVARVREAARGEGATLNDLLVTALAGALRGQLAAQGDDPDRARVRALVPVNLRPGPPAPGEALGNRFGLVFLELPVDLPTPAARLEAVRARMEEAKRRPDALATFGVLALLGRLPALQPWVTGFFSRKASLVVTNVPGPRAPLHVAGHRLEEAMFWVPHPAALGLGVSLLTYAGAVRMGVRADAAVMDDPADLVRRFEEELAPRAPRAGGAGLDGAQGGRTRSHGRGAHARAAAARTHRH